MGLRIFILLIEIDKNLNTTSNMSSNQNLIKKNLQLMVALQFVTQKRLLGSGTELNEIL